MSRRATVERVTTESRVRVEIELDGTGRASARTGLGFFDHMLEALGRHARFDMSVEAQGDLHVDEHHTVEDVALTLGQALREALGDRVGIARFGSGFAPLDEALARAVVDISGRAHAEIDLGLRHERQGEVLSENLTHFFRSLAQAAQLALHVDVLRGANDHHRVEAAYKATAVALREAVTRVGGTEVPSTKGVL